MQSKTYRYQLTLSIGLAGCLQEDEIDLEELGYSYEEWEKLTDGEKEEILDNYAREWANEYISISHKDFFA